MKRSQWLFLLCVAVLGLAPSFAWAITPFQATEVSTLTIQGTTTAGGLVKLQNTGIVIDNLAGSSYTPLGTNVPIMGFAGMIDAVYDGADGQNDDWNATQGIMGINAQASPGLYNIAFDYNTDAGFTHWGGVDLTTARTANAFLIRETYLGDSSLGGSVTPSDYTTWLKNQGTKPSGDQQGNAAGDYAYESLIYGGPVGGAAYSAWLATQGQTALGGGSYTGPVQAAGVASVPEPSTVALLVAALLIAACVMIKRFSSNRFTVLFAKGLRGMPAARLLLLVTCVVLGLATVANADLVYILRPVTGDPTDKNEGSYTISGNGLTTPWTVTIGQGSANKDVSFELYAAIINTAAGSTGWANQGLGQGQVWLNSTPGTTPLAWTADAPNSALYSAYAWYQSTIGGAGSAASQWGVPTWAGASPPGTVINAQQASTTQFYPPSTMNLLNNAGTAWSSTPPSAMNLTVSGGTDTWGLVKIGDLAINYGTLASGESTIIQALPATRSGSGRASALVAYNGTPGSLVTNTTLLVSQIGTTLTSSGGSTLGVDITYSGGGGTGTTVSGVTDITSGPTFGAPWVWSGGTTTVSGALTNSSTATGSNTQDAVNWTAAATAVSGKVSPTSMTGAALTSGSSAPLSYTYTAPSTFGWDTVTLTPSGANSTIGGSAGSQSGSKTGTINIYGLVTTSGGTVTSAPVAASNGSFAGLTASTSGSVFLGTTASILAGTNTGSSATTVTMSFSPASTGPTNHAVFSDITNLGGISNGTPYVFQTSYSTAQLAALTSYTSPAAAYNAGQLYLGYNNSGKWVNAASYNGLTPSMATYGTQAPTTNLAGLLGDFGAYDANGTGYVWAVVNYDAGFAAVPEPGTLALLAAGALALGVAYRRRRVAKA